MPKCERCHFEVRKNGECFCSGVGDLQFINDIPEHYNRGLGMVIKSRRQYNAELKERNLIEVGNEKKHIEPEYGRKLKEKQRDLFYSKLRGEAHQMLGRYPEFN